MLLEMIKKREKLKREYISVITAIVKLELIVQKKKTDGFGGYKTLSKLKREKREVEIVNDEESEPESEVSDGEEELTSPDYEEQNGDTDIDDNEEEDIYTKENTGTEYDTYSSVQLPGISEFRGRARVGRGGRIIFDRLYMYMDDDPSMDYIPNGFNHSHKNYNTRSNGLNHIKKDDEEMQLDESNSNATFHSFF